MATRDDIIEQIQVNLAVAGKPGTSKADCAVALDAVLNAVALVGFGSTQGVRTKIGTFSRKETPERTGRNPRTGEPLVVPAKTTLKFSPSKALGVTLTEQLANPVTAPAAPEGEKKVAKKLVRK